MQSTSSDNKLVTTQKVLERSQKSSPSKMRLNEDTIYNLVQFMSINGVLRNQKSYCSYLSKLIQRIGRIPLGQIFEGHSNIQQSQNQQSMGVLKQQAETENRRDQSTTKSRLQLKTRNKIIDSYRLLISYIKMIKMRIKGSGMREQYFKYYTFMIDKLHKMVVDMHQFCFNKYRKQLLQKQNQNKQAQVMVDFYGYMLAIFQSELMSPGMEVMNIQNSYNLHGAKHIYQENKNRISKQSLDQVSHANRVLQGSYGDDYIYCLDYLSNYPKQPLIYNSGRTASNVNHRLVCIGQQIPFPHTNQCWNCINYLFLGQKLQMQRASANSLQNKSYIILTLNRQESQQIILKTNKRRDIFENYLCRIFDRGSGYIYIGLQQIQVHLGPAKSNQSKSQHNIKNKSKGAIKQISATKYMYNVQGVIIKEALQAYKNKLKKMMVQISGYIRPEVFDNDMRIQEIFSDEKNHFKIQEIPVFQYSQNEIKLQNKQVLPKLLKNCYIIKISIDLKQLKTLWKFYIQTSVLQNQNKFTFFPLSNKQSSLRLNQTTNKKCSSSKKLNDILQGKGIYEQIIQKYYRVNKQKQRRGMISQNGPNLYTPQQSNHYPLSCCQSKINIDHFQYSSRQLTDSEETGLQKLNDAKNPQNLKQIYEQFKNSQKNNYFKNQIQSIDTEKNLLNNVMQKIPNPHASHYDYNTTYNITNTNNYFAGYLQHYSLQNQQKQVSGQNLVGLGFKQFKIVNQYGRPPLGRYNHNSILIVNKKSNSIEILDSFLRDLKQRKINFQYYEVYQNLPKKSTRKSYFFNHDKDYDKINKIALEHDPQKHNIVLLDIRQQLVLMNSQQYQCAAKMLNSRFKKIFSANFIIATKQNLNENKKGAQLLYYFQFDHWIQATFAFILFQYQNIKCNFVNKSKLQNATFYEI